MTNGVRGANLLELSLASRQAREILSDVRRTSRARIDISGRRVLQGLQPRQSGR